MWKLHDSTDLHVLRYYCFASQRIESSSIATKSCQRIGKLLWHSFMEQPIEEEDKFMEKNCNEPFRQEKLSGYSEEI